MMGIRRAVAASLVGGLLVVSMSSAWAEEATTPATDPGAAAQQGADPAQKATADSRNPRAEHALERAAGAAATPPRLTEVTRTAPAGTEQDRTRLDALRNMLASAQGAPAAAEPRAAIGEPCAQATYTDTSLDVDAIDVVTIGYQYYCSDEEYYFGLFTRDAWYAGDGLDDLYDFWLAFDADRKANTGCQASLSRGAERAGVWDWESGPGPWYYGDFGTVNSDCYLSPQSSFLIYHDDPSQFIGAIVSASQIGTNTFNWKAIIESWQDDQDHAPNSGFVSGSRPSGNVYFIADSFTSTAERVVVYGRPDDQTIAGDWNGDKADSLGVRRGNTYYLNNSLSGGAADITVAFGKPTDQTFTGDWDANLSDTLGLRRGNTFFLNNTFAGGAAQITFAYGKPADQVYVGDWDGNGTDTFALRRGNQFFISNSYQGGNAGIVFSYGKTTDQVLVGDWDGDGDDTLGVRRGNVLYLNNELRGGPAETVISYGRANDRIYIGDWNGDSISTPTVRR